MKKSLTFIVVLLALITAGSAHAKPVTESQKKAARDFVGLFMHIPNLPLPVVNQDPAEWSRMKNLNPLVKPYSFYYKGVIYLPPYFDSEFDDMVFLIHEEVHAAQEFSHKKYPCHNAKEREAYEAQNAYAKMFGINIQISDEAIAKRSQCD